MGRCAFRAGSACMDKEQAVGQSMRMVCFWGKPGELDRREGVGFWLLDFA